MEDESRSTHRPAAVVHTFYSKRVSFTHGRNLAGAVSRSLHPAAAECTRVAAASGAGFDIKSGQSRFGQIATNVVLGWLDFFSQSNNADLDRKVCPTRQTRAVSGSVSSLLVQNHCT